jgi:Fe-S-cluster-containing hydrogenase component 2
MFFIVLDYDLCVLCGLCDLIFAFGLLVIYHFGMHTHGNFKLGRG